MPRHWLLDTGVIVVFQRAGDLHLLRSLAATGTLAVVAEVYDELTGRRLRKPPPPDARARFAEVEAFLDEAVVVESIDLDSPADEARTALRAGRSSARADLGEDASIALALTRETFTLVTNDEVAAGRALRELPGRVAMVHDVLRLLVETDLSLRDRAAHVSEAARLALAQVPAKWGAREPLWWQPWLSKV